MVGFVVSLRTVSQKPSTKETLIMGQVSLLPVKIVIYEMRIFLDSELGIIINI